MKRFSDRVYRAWRFFAYCLLRLAHPVVRIRGRENVPQGAAVIAANHSSFTDAIWVHIAAKPQRRPLTMAKKELMEIPVLGKLYHKLGAFPVDREGSDIQAIKISLQCLRDDNKLVIFPEGTRIRKGKISQPHKGTVMLACRAKVDILPVYLTAKKRFFCPIDIVIGKPYAPEFEGAKPTAEDLERLTDEMMRTIYQLGDKQ